MTRLLCCLRARADMGAAISHPQEGEACDGGVLASPPTMADVIRERKKKAGGAGLGTLRRRIAAAARRPRDSRPDRGCEHARFIRSVVGSWRLSDVFQLCAELEAGAALRDLATQAELAREPAPALHADLAAMRAERWWCDVEVVGAGFSIPAHKVILASRCTYFRDLLQRYPRSWRVPLEGAGASLSREEVEAAILALYAGAAPSAHPCEHCRKWDRGLNSEADLDIISVENSTNRRCTCTTNTQGGGTRNRRLGALLGFSIGGGALARDLRRVLESGELADARLAWPESSLGTGGTGGSYGFRGSAELPCHRLLLAARSRFFRNVLSRRCTSTSGPGGVGGVGGVGGAGGATIVCVDEKVLPRRFARALLHAAYTDQVDLSLIGRSSSSPSSTNSSSGTLRGNGRGSAIAMLDDAFQLYEIARFLEMPIVAQGCEDAAARALCADTLPHALRWAAAPHASAWLHRQAMRYLRDEFPTVMASPSAARLPRASLASALASPFLQASEAQALRALLRWAERAVQPTPASSSPAIAPEPNLLWHTTHARRAARARRRAAPDAALRDALADLLPLLRLEHLPADCDARALAARRGLLPPPAPAPPPAPSPPDAWLGRAGCRPVRCFLPYLDELRALLQDQAPITTNRRPPPSSTGDTGGIPDTLYMVAAAAAAATAWGNACVPPRVLRALRARAAELRAAPAAQRALALHAGDVRPVRRQIALRAVREMSLPDACAELLLNDTDVVDTHDARENHHGGQHRESSEEWERGNTSASRSDLDDDCCRSGSGSGSIRGASGGVSHVSAHASLESRSGACRRELPTRPLDGHSSRNGTYNRARLSAAVPDVAMAPNANTHLLTARDYPHPLAHTHTHAHSHGSGTPAHGHAAHHGVGLQHPHVMHSVHSELGGVLQLDLGDGATHTPRPGSRAQRAARQHREHSQGISCPRRDDDELRAAIELSVIRAYSSLQVARRAPHIADLLPPPDFAAIRNRATPSPSSLSASSSRRRDTPNSHAHSHTNPRPHVQLSTTSNASGSSSSTSNVATGSIPSGSGGLGVVGGVGSVGGPGVVGGSRSPSPRRSPYPLYALYANRDLGRSSRSRGPSPHAHAYA